MRNNHFNLNGTISIYFDNEVLIGPMHYRLLNLIITDSNLNSVTEKLNISKQKALSLINSINRVAPMPVTNAIKKREETIFKITDFGSRLINSYTQKELDFFMFLQKSDKHLNNSFMNSIEENHSFKSFTKDVY